MLCLGRDLRRKGVSSYPWSRIPGELPLADFDVVFLDFTLEGVIDAPNFPTPSQWASPLLMGNMRIVCIGSPMADFLYPQSGVPTPVADGAPVPRPAWSWLPEFPETYERPGTRIVLGRRERFADYFDRVAAYTWVVRQSWQGSPYKKQYIQSLGLDQEKYAIKRYGEGLADAMTSEPVAVRLSFHVHNHKLGTPVFDNNASVYWLPAPKDPDDPEVWTALMQVFDIATTTPKPDWITAYQTPSEANARGVLSKRHEELVAIEKAYSEAKAATEHESRYGALLYAQGDELEAVVRDALQVLGVDVDPDDGGSNQDVYITLPSGTRGAVEVKGVKGFLSKHALRQAHDWKSDGVEREPEKRWKAIVIGNTHRGIAPAERPDPYDSTNQVRYAERENICVIPTLLVFVAIQQLQLDEFDPKDFWSRVEATAGILRWPDPSTGASLGGDDEVRA